MIKTILILGSNSFAGSNFINYILRKNLKVVAVSRSAEYRNELLAYHKLKKKVKFYRVDINNNLKRLEKIINKFKPSYIVNFSSQGMVGQSWVWPAHWYQTNILSQVKLIEILKKNNYIKKYIHFSTPEVYGSTNKKIKESFNFNPSTPYAVSRAALDLHLKILYLNYKFPVIFTRAANIFGPYQAIYRIIPKTIISCLKKKKLGLEGGGKSIRSFIYIDDVSDALYNVIKKGKIGNTYHISTDEFISIKELTQLIIKKLGKDPGKILEIKKDRIGKDSKYLLDSKKIRKNLGWSSKISLSNGIDKTIEWIKDNRSLLRMSLEYKHKK